MECIEHLNLYGDYYLPEIRQRIASAKSSPSPVFKSGLLGNYFAQNDAAPREVEHHETFKDKNPLGSKLEVSALTKFQNQNLEMLELLDSAESQSATHQNLHQHFKSD